jgi:hypothetical protein
MDELVFEVVELASGEIALQRVDRVGGQEPLVTIRFSHEARHYLKNQHGEIARVMIEAGMQAVEQMQDVIEEVIHQDDSPALH